MTSEAVPDREVFFLDHVRQNAGDGARWNQPRIWESAGTTVDSL